jgi:hypothetical protein
MWLVAISSAAKRCTYAVLALVVALYISWLHVKHEYIGDRLRRWPTPWAALRGGAGGGGGAGSAPREPRSLGVVLAEAGAIDIKCMCLVMAW